MIPTTRAYENSKVTPGRSRADVEDLLAKFNITNTMWKRDDPKLSYFVFQKPFEGIAEKIAYKVGVPFIENKSGYNEVRSYRFFFHIFKAAMLNFDIGMEFEQIFGNYMVVGQLKDGTPESIQDRVVGQLLVGKHPALEAPAK